MNHDQRTARREQSTDKTGNAAENGMGARDADERSGAKPIGEQTMIAPNLDAGAIRITLTEVLTASHAGPGIIIHELGLSKGRCRMDLVLVTDRIRGFEIKADTDGWTRLEKQVRMYSRAVDEATLVVGRKAASAWERIPKWWGLWSVHSEDDNRLEVIRKARPNPDLEPVAMAEFLWREEALTLARTHGIARGVLSKNRDAIWSRLADRLPLGTIREAAVEALINPRYDNIAGRNRSVKLSRGKKDQ